MAETQKDLSAAGIAANKAWANRRVSTAPPERSKSCWGVLMAGVLLIAGVSYTAYETARYVVSAPSQEEQLTSDYDQYQQAEAYESPAHIPLDFIGSVAING